MISNAPAADLFDLEPPRFVLPSLLKLSEDDFYRLVAENPDQSLEQSPQGELILMSPTGLSTGLRNNEILFQLTLWNKQHRRGIVFDSSSLFRLPKHSARLPNAAWVELTRWDRLTPKQQKTFGPLNPNFVIELRSESDVPTDLQEKLVEYLDNGVELGWIVDPLLRQVHVYEQGRPPRVLDQPVMVNGTGCMEGFTLDLREIFAETRESE